MKLALVLLSLAVFNSNSSYAQAGREKICKAAVSKVSQSSTQEMWRGLAKNSRDLYAVTDTLRENRKIMEEFAQAGKPFDLVRDEAAKMGFPFAYYNIRYYERVYWKMYIDKNCPESALEADSTTPRDPIANQGQVTIQNDDFFENQVNDATRSLGPAPDTTTPAETER